MKKIAVIFLSLLVTPAVAATGSIFIRQDNRGNTEEVLPYATLCNVHIYNIGETTPSQDLARMPEKREEMNQVIALKSTLITQEMKRQYDFLEATIRRFETQLQKAVLVSRLEAAGGTRGDNSGGATGGGAGASANMLPGMQDCEVPATIAGRLDCLSNNMSRLRENIASRQNMSQVQRQMQSDLDKVRLLTGNKTPDGCNTGQWENDWTNMERCRSAMGMAVMTEVDNRNRQAQTAGRGGMGGF
ncbi:MAG: hypothetical protein FWF34_01160 [Alphaproteobacteria bacterium]|nr:hypothetical protein [Alphaproteobacteria bacterium]MCL2889850.1 hypothetical protein [Alphaproteobacteria bacterium]